MPLSFLEVTAADRLYAPPGAVMSVVPSPQGKDWCMVTIAGEIYGTVNLVDYSSGCYTLMQDSHAGHLKDLIRQSSKTPPASAHKSLRKQDMFCLVRQSLRSPGLKDLGLKVSTDRDPAFVIETDFTAKDLIERESKKVVDAFKGKWV